MVMIPPQEAEFDGERFLPGQGGTTIAVEHSHRYLFAAQVLGPGNVLDVGCGAGYGSRLLGDQKSYVGIDASQESVDLAGRHFGSATVHFRVGDAMNLPFDTDSFDNVTCFELLEHVSDPGVVVAEVARVMRPGGIFVSSTPDRDEYNRLRTEPNPFHPSEMSLSEYAGILEPHFSRIHMLGQRYCAGSAIFGLPASGGQASMMMPPEWVSVPPVAEYHVAVASTEPLSVISASSMPTGDESLLAQTESLLARTQHALAAADQREIRAREQLAAYELMIRDLQSQLADRSN